MKLSGLVRGVQAFSRELSNGWNVTPSRLKLGIALGGGFARGIAHVGALKVLEEENIPIDFVAGTSVGAIIGASYCSGMTAAELADMARTLRFADFARLTLSRYGFYSNDRMVRFFARVLKRHTFEDLKIPLAITATEFRTGEAVVFTKGALADPIRASCAYPGMFLPVEIDGRSYIDGMLAYAVPTTPLRRMGADRVIGMYLSSHWSNARPPRHVFEVIGQCFSIAQSKLSESWMKDADLVLEPDVAGFAYDCFERTPELIAAGETAMRRALPQVREMLSLPQPSKSQKTELAPVVTTAAPPQASPAA
ncbi:MAG TPA: patatin-like phospholipase family protein [Candidatus Acidoferrum sp.]|nr:patatin-like phospholipase family protein [Candidatus Acidoferrum sp.]